MNPSKIPFSTSHLPSNKTVASLWIALGGAVCLLVLVSLVRQSFFFDGGIYASLARNLAEGTGSFWSPHFSKTLFSVFSEHPPLMIWLESIGFAIFGDTVVVEKGFSLLTFLISGFLLIKIWERLHAGDPLLQKAAPLALLMTLVAGRVNWGFANGMLENLLIVFTLSAVFLIILAYDVRQTISAWRRMVLIVCAGFAIVLALLTKGPVGLFPLAVPAIYWVSFRRPSFWAVVLDSAILAGVISLFFLVLWQFNAPWEATQRYFAAQLFASINGDRGHFGSGWAVLRKILGINGYSLAVVAVLFAIGRRWSETGAIQALSGDRWRRATFLLLIGCSASLPIAVSARVVNHYFNPSLPYFSAGFCVLFAPVLMEGLGKLTSKAQRCLWMASIGLLTVSLVVVAVNFDRPGKDGATIAIAREVANIVCGSQAPCGETVSACGDVWQDWALHTYMQRYYKISMADAPILSQYVISDEKCQLDGSYVDTGVDIAPYRLLTAPL